MCSRLSALGSNAAAAVMSVTIPSTSLPDRDLEKLAIERDVRNL
jgi:hypothetical protein